MANELAVVNDFCELSKTSLKFKREVTKSEWAKVFSGLKTIEGCVQFWIGDCLNYREYKWGEKYDDAILDSEYDEGTLRNITSVAKNVELSFRNDKLSFAHHQQVAPLEQEKQEKYLKLAVDKKLSVRELRDVIKTDKHNSLPKVELPKGKYSVIYADPPWDVKAGPGWASGEESRDLEYPTMSIEEITKLPVSDLSAENSHLYLWTINKYIHESFHIIEEWGFEFSCLLTWCKPPHGIGLGGTFVQTTEHILFCRKGTLEAKKRIDTTWFEYKRGKHSVKPNEIRKMIEEVSPGKKIELFARTKSLGWDVWGNEV